VFGSTTFSTYGGFWLSLGIFVVLAETTKLAVAWYTSAAGVVNGMSPTPVVPVGRPLWGRLPMLSRLDSPMPRRTEV
jgi:succinate-acetate transporter protein